MAERVQVLTLCCTTIRAEYYHWQVRLLLLTVLVEFFSKLQGKTHNFQMDPRSRPFIVVGGSKRSPCYWKYAYAIGGREKVFFSLLSDAYLVAKSVVLPTPSSGHLQWSVLHQLDGSTDGYARYNRPWAQARSVAPALQDLPLEGNRGFISHLGGTYLPFGLLGRHCCFRAKACFIHATSQHAAPRHTLFIHKIEFEDFHVHLGF